MNLISGSARTSEMLKKRHRMRTVLLLNSGDAASLVQAKWKSDITLVSHYRRVLLSVDCAARVST